MIENYTDGYIFLMSNNAIVDFFLVFVVSLVSLSGRLLGLSCNYCMGSCGGQGWILYPSIPFGCGD